MKKRANKRNEDTNLVQHGADDLANEEAVVAAHRLDPLRIHLVVVVGIRPVHPSVALLVHEQVGEVHFLELQSHRRRKELARDPLRGFLAEAHALRHRVDSELDHHTVRVAVDNFGVGGVPIRDGVHGLHRVLRREQRGRKEKDEQRKERITWKGSSTYLRVLDHRPTVRCRRRRDREARELAHRGAREAVDGVRRYLQRQLPPVLHGFHHRIFRRLHVLLRLLPRAKELGEDGGEDALLRRRLDEDIARGRLLVRRRIEFRDVFLRGQEEARTVRGEAKRQAERRGETQRQAARRGEVGSGERGEPPNRTTQFISAQATDALSRRASSSTGCAPS